MKTLSVLFMMLAVLAVAAFAQPTVTQVSNAASSALPPLQNSSIAQGSYFSVYGSGLGLSSSACGANFGNCYWYSNRDVYPLPTQLNQSSVSVTVNGTTKSAYIEFAYDGQINAVLPSDVPAGAGNLTVTYNGQTSATFAVTVVASSFGTFAWNSAGSGPGVITDVNYVDLTPFHTAKPGDYVILWGTGLGPVPDAAAEQAGPPTINNLCADASTCPVTVWVAGSKANIYYAGRSTYTAEDQIVFQVPTGAQGCYVQVAVQTGSVVGNFTSMPVDPNGATCQDADGINYNDVASAVQSNGAAKILAVSMLSNYLNLNLGILGTVPWDNDTITGQIGSYPTFALQAYQGVALAPSVGNCSALPFLQYPPPSDPAAAYATFLDAGSSLSIQGPNRTVNIVKVDNTAGNPVGYQGQMGTPPTGTPPDPVVGGQTVNELITGCPSWRSDGCVPFFLNSSFAVTPGTYTITGSGGANVGAISGSISVSSGAQTFQWTNEDSITATSIPRNTPLTITWSGGDPNGFVDITAVSSTAQAASGPTTTTPGILVECIAPASQLSFQIPTYVLQSLPTNAGSQSVIPPGELLVGPASPVTKITTPSGLDAAYIYYHFIQGTNVSWQ